MCCRFEVGRIKLDVYEKVYEQYHSFHIKDKGEIFPGDIVLVSVLNKNREIIYYPMKWGYQIKDKLVYNARAESIDTKVSFALDYKKHRCIIPCLCYYEFDKDKNKYSIKTNNEITYLAGIYRLINNQYEFTILTKKPVDDISHIHHRMPVIIDKNDINDYLFNNIDTDLLINKEDIKLNFNIINK